MKLGQDILLDDTNCFRWLRDRFRQVATRHGYQTRVIYLDIPLSHIRLRMQRNEATKERHTLQEHIFEALVRDFEPPEADENVLMFNQDHLKDDWVRIYFPQTIDF